MEIRNIESFLLSSLLCLIVFAIIMVPVHILVFNFFDTSANIQEYKAQALYEAIVTFVILMIIALGTIFILGFKKQFRFWGSISTILVISIILGFQFKEHAFTKQFEKHSWSIDEKNKFIEARSIALNNSFQGLDKLSVVENLGHPIYIGSNQFKYEINDFYDWGLLFEFDSCCVIKTELIKEPWNL